MSTALRNAPVITCLCFALAAILASTSVAEEGASSAIVRQVLKRPGSNVTFGVRSPAPTLNMNGSFASYSGLLLRHPDGLEYSGVELTLDMQSARLQPDQILQAVFLQTALAHMRERKATFKSTSIRRVGASKLLVDGTYTWRGKVRTATVPLQLLRSTNNITELKLLLDGTMEEKDVPPELAKMGGSSASGWAKATLLFSSAS